MTPETCMKRTSVHIKNTWQLCNVKDCDFAVAFRVQAKPFRDLQETDPRARTLIAWPEDERANHEATRLQWNF